jgi:RNA 2',3'-cyclic 3'-phosphodiesterase
MESIRSFIAIELPDELRAELGKLQSSLISGQQNWVKWVKPDSIHLTLKFLGDISAGQIKEITQAIEEGASEIPPFALQIKDLGVFPNLKRIQVVWVGLNGDLDRLTKLQRRIEENMVILGYQAEERDFTPHLTLGRVRFQPPPPDLQKLTKLITETKFESKIKIDVSTVHLMKSQLTPQGAIYSKLNSVNLKLFP